MGELFDLIEGPNEPTATQHANLSCLPFRLHSRSLLRNWLLNPLPRILFVSYTSELTGPTNSLFLLIKHLSGLVEPVVLIPGDGPFKDRLLSAGLAVRSFRSLGKASLFRMAALIRAEGIDLVYGNDTSGAAKNAFIAAKLLGRPFVYHVRAMAGSANWRKVGFLRHADAVIAVSEATARSYSHFLPSGLPHVIYNGVDLDDFEIDRVAARRDIELRLGLDHEAIILLQVGNLDARKAPEYAVRAVAAIRKVNPSVHLVLAGRRGRDPSYAKKLSSLIDRLELRAGVSLLGFEPSINRVLAASDILVHTASEDPHPRVIVEAMACGLPVVAFAADGVPETIVDQVTGLLVNVGDGVGLEAALSRLVESPGLRRRLGYSGRARAEGSFTAAQTAGSVADVIRTVLHRPHTSEIAPRPRGQGEPERIRE